MKVIVKLVKTLECRGSNGRTFSHEMQVARREYPGIPAGLSTDGYEREITLIINDGNLEFDRLRCHKERNFKPEDLNFANFI